MRIWRMLTNWLLPMFAALNSCRIKFHLSYRAMPHEEPLTQKFIARVLADRNTNNRYLNLPTPICNHGYMQETKEREQYV